VFAKLCLAPLHGITDYAFRKAYFATFPGFDEAMAPFIASTRCSRASKNHFKDLLPEKNDGLKLIPQVLSNDAPGMITTARILADMGYDEMNWNIACPVSRVTRKRRGSALLSQPEQIEEILSQICNGIRIAISLKIRLGWNDHRDILTLMPMFNQFPLKRIIVHPRTGVQMYEGGVDLDTFTEAVGLSNHDIVYNGDIKDLETFESLRQRYPTILEWMIGRWAIHDPFLAGQIKGVGQEYDPIEKIRVFHDELYLRYQEILYGPIHVLNKMKEIWSYLGASFPKNRSELGEIVQSQDLPAYETAVRTLFINSGNGK